MANRFTLSKKAVLDIKAITLKSLADFGFPQTDKYVKGMKTTLQSLADERIVGKEFTNIESGRVYFHYRYVSHTIFYRRRKNDILIVRVLHKRMLPEQQ